MKYRFVLAAMTAMTVVPVAPGAARDTPATQAAPEPAASGLVPSAAPSAAVTQASAAPNTAPVETAAAEPSCELHVFPTLEGQAVTTGWLSGMGFIGAAVDASKNKDRNISEAEYLKEALGPKMQVEALQKIDLLAALHLPPSKVIYETPIADRKISTKAKTRLSSSTAPCYVELLVTQNLYSKKAIYGRSLNNRFIFKDFRNGRANTNLVKGRGGNGLSHFPPKTTDETDAAEQELREVFDKNFVEFSKSIHAS